MTGLTDPIIGHYTMWENNPRWEDSFPNFSPKSVATENTGMLRIHLPAMEGLQGVRTDLMSDPHFLRLYLPGKGGLWINCGYRDEAQNKADGGGTRSQHLRGRAFDISLRPARPGKWQEYGDMIEDAAIKRGFNGIGRYNSFIHIDMREPKPNGDLYMWDFRSKK